MYISYINRTWGARAGRCPPGPSVGKMSNFYWESCVGVIIDFECQNGYIWEPRSSHFGSLFDEKTLQESIIFLILVFIDFGIDFEAKMRSKILKKSIKIS